MNQKIYFNPITNLISKSIEDTNIELLIAVPFISGFAKSILTKERMSKIKQMKLLTCFDDTNLNSFELETLQYFLDNGMEIRYNNDIHLKLYLFDKEGFISSSNLTKSGFENSIEITTTIEEKSISQCKDFFFELWQSSEKNKITKEIIQENYSKYLLLKKRTKNKKTKPLTISTKELNISNLNIEALINHIFEAKQDFSYITNKVYLANKEREKLKEQINNGFDVEDFYVPKEHKKRKESLYYKMVFGKEAFIAGTGLREGHFREAFQNEKFEEIISYIFPPIIGKENWDLDNPKIFREYCNGIFEYRIHSYLEILPIRLASYFYPKHFLPIFKLSHLGQVCKILGLETNAKSKGDKLYVFNSFLLKKMNAIPFGNYVKSHIAYQLFYTVELYNRLVEGDNFNSIVNSYEEKWIQDYIHKGKNLLDDMKNN